MPKRNKQSVFTITRKGLIIWAVLSFFIAGWMFVLGILVGRGMAPISMNVDRFEQEIATLKAALKKKENEQMPNASELDYPEVLTGNKPPKDREVDPRLIDRETRESDVEPKPKIQKQDTSKKAVPQQASKPESSYIKKGNYTIQIAAYKNATYSRHLVNQLKEKGFPAFQVQSPSGGGKAVMYRVRVGAFENRRAAETILTKLRSRQYDGLVVSTK